MKLVLEDGTEVSVSSSGVSRGVAGEVVFNTGMTGYIEAMTDPSYRRQILVFTYPLVGNYGIPAPRPEGSLDLRFESSRIQIQGQGAQDLVDTYSDHSATRSLAEWLDSEQIPYITGIDTQTLT